MVITGKRLIDPLFNTHKPDLSEWLDGMNNASRTYYGTERMEEVDPLLAKAKSDLDALANNLEIGKPVTDEEAQRWTAAANALAEAKKRIRLAYIENLKGDSSLILTHLKEAASAPELAELYADHIDRSKRLWMYASMGLAQRRDKMPADAIKEDEKRLRIMKRNGTRGYTTYRRFIEEYAELQLYALEYYKLPTDEAHALLDNIAAQRYKPPKDSAVSSVRDKGNASVIELLPGYMVSPTSWLLYAVMDIVSADGLAGLEVFKTRRERDNRTSVTLAPVTEGYPARINPSGRAITLKTEDKKRNKTSVMTITIDDIESIQGRNNPLAAVVAYVFMEVARQAISNGDLVRPEVIIPLRDMVELGMYKNVDTARRSMKQAIKWLTRVQLTAEENTPQKSERFAVATLFTYGEVNNSVVTLVPNDRISWGMIASHYMNLPRYYFRIKSKKAQRLVYYLHQMMRTNAAKIARKGYFAISLRTIHDVLELPSEIGCPNPMRDIKEKVYAAFYAIEDEHKKDFDRDPLEISFTVSDDVPISDWLNGEVQIKPNAALMGSLQEIRGAKQKRIASSKKQNRDKP